VTDTEVGALLSADMRDERYYEKKLQMAHAQKSPRYKGYVEHEMEMPTSPRTGPIGLPEMNAKKKPQTLQAGRPVRPTDEMKNAGNSDELMYQGHHSLVQKPESHAIAARQRVQQKTSTEKIKMEQEHTAMKSYLNQYETEKNYRTNQSQVERKKDMEMLKTYNPFGKPGGGAPLKTKSGRDLPKMKADFDIRFRDDDYHKKMVDNKRYRNLDNVQNEYKHVLDQQVGEKNYIQEEQRQIEKFQEEESMKFNPYGKPGSGAPRFHEKHGTSRHWSKLEPAASKSSFETKRNRLQIQQQDNMKQADYVRENKKSPRNAHSKKQADPVYNPWGRGAGNPRYDDQGNVNVRFGMKTNYDIFNKNSLVTTHSGATLGGWPLPTNESGDQHLHSPHEQPGGQSPHRKGYLARRHGETFVTEQSQAQHHPLLNGKEAAIIDAGSRNRHPEMLKRQGALSKIQGQSFAGQKVRTENPEGVWEGMNEGKPSAGTLKRELENDNKILNLKVNNAADMLRSPRTESAKNGDNQTNHHARDYDISNRGSTVTFSKNNQVKTITNSPRSAGATNSGSSNDVADWMRSKAVCQPERDVISGLIKPTRRITSDVTRHRLDLRSHANAHNYHEELSRQVAERRMRENYEKQQDRRETANWDNNLSDNFGKPGGGAPTDRRPNRRQFNNPSMMPQIQAGTHVPSSNDYDNNINSNIGGVGHGAPHDKGFNRRIFSNAALVPATQLGTGIPKVVGDKPTTVGSLMNTENLDKPYRVRN